MSRKPRARGRLAPLAGRAAIWANSSVATGRESRLEGADLASGSTPSVRWAASAPDRKAPIRPQHPRLGPRLARAPPVPAQRLFVRRFEAETGRRPPRCKASAIGRRERLRTRADRHGANAGS